MKRSRLAVIAAILLVFSLSLAISAASNTNATAKTPFDALVKLGYISGLNTSDNVTRADALTALLRVTAKELDASSFEGDGTFLDSDEAVILYAFEHGIIKGDGNGFFSPSRYVTLNEMLIMSLRALGYEDVSAENAYTLAKEAKIYTYSEQDEYYYYLTAERMAEILWNMLSANATNEGDGEGAGEGESATYADLLIGMNLLDSELYSQVVSEVKYEFGDITDASIKFWEDPNWSGIWRP